MKNKKFIHGLSKSGHCGFLSKRMVWQNPEKAPNVEAQKEFKEIGDLVMQLEKTQQEIGVTYNKLLVRIENKIKEKGRYFSPELLDALADRKEASIRELVAMCPNTTSETMARLAQDKNEGVRYAARKYLEGIHDESYPKPKRYKLVKTVKEKK